MTCPTCKIPLEDKRQKSLESQKQALKDAPPHHRAEEGQTSRNAKADEETLLPDAHAKEQFPDGGKSAAKKKTKQQQQQQQSAKVKKKMLCHCCQRSLLSLCVVLRRPQGLRKR